MWIYEAADESGGESNLFVHHSLILPAFPLSLAWLSCGPSKEQNGNFAAVGTMDPGIEIWNLDIVDSVEPAVTLGGAERTNPLGLSHSDLTSKKKKKKKSSKVTYTLDPLQYLVSNPGHM